MEKQQQIKPKKDKKKNTETGMLMGQNINVFSQLSATYLTNKAVTTQEEEHFVKETQIIEYHDQNVNRIISLLRKKAEVTKVKAVIELKQAISQMSETDMEQFIPTFANLYQQIVVNQQSKQVYEEFVEIAASIVEKYKKVALREISTLYPVMLLSMKLMKVGKLLFTGTEQEISEKSYLLFAKKEVKKKFLLLSKLLLETQQLHVISQSNYQRNLHQYVKMLKEMLTIYLEHSKINDLRDATITIVRDICEMLSGKTIDEYFKIGGRGKASLLQIYAYLVKFSTLQKQCEVNWRKLAKIVCQHFLDKDPIVQTTMWKYCNKDLLIGLKQLARQQQRQDEYSIFNELLPKSQDRLVESLGLGGLSMYKSLPLYIKEHQSFVFTPNDNHKLIVQKLTFQRKFLQSILNQEDENQARIDCYYLIAEYIIQNCMELEKEKLERIIMEKEGEKLQDSKKAKEIKSLIDKLRTETVANLEKRYYMDPPASKNSFTYYIPEYFAKLLNTYKFPSFTPTFNEKLTFALYKSLKTVSPFLQAIYTKCESNLSLLLNFYETWTHTDKEVNLEMTEENDEYEKTAKIFLLSNKSRVENQNYWFLNSWDLRKSAIVYDPRLTTKDLENDNVEQAHSMNIHFSPIHKQLPQIYNIPELNKHRFTFFINLLENPEIQPSNIKFFLPFLFSHLITEDNIEVLMQKYMHKMNDLKHSKWIVGEREITFLRILVQCFNIHLLKQEKNVSEKIINKFKPYFLSIGSFLRTLNTYKMDSIVMQILKELNQLLRVPQYEELLLQSLQVLLSSIYVMITKGSPQQEKHRKNRLKRINEFVEHCIWYMVKKGSGNYSLLLIELFKEDKLWQYAQSQIEPWAIGYTILNLCDDSTIDKTVKEMILGFNEHYRMVSLVIACQLIIPLQVYPEYKRTFLQMRHWLLKQYSKMLTTQQQLFNLQQLITYQYEQLKLTEAQGVKTLVKNIVKNHHEFQQSQISTLAKDIVQFFIERLIEEKEGNHQQYNENQRDKLSIKTIIVTIILTEMPLQDLAKEIEGSYEIVLELLEKETKNLQSHYQKFLSICLLSSVLWRTSIGEETIAKWESLSLTKQLLSQLIPSINEIEPLTTYHSYVIFSTINSLYPILGYELIAGNIDTVMKLFWTKKTKQGELYIFEQEEKIRLINRIYLEIPKQTAYQVIQQLPQQALNEYSHYEKFLLELEEQEEYQNEEEEQQQQQQQIQLQQKSIHNLFIEYSELLMKITTFISLGNTLKIPSQHTLVSLLQCPFPGIKKTSFILLKQLYEYKLVTPAIPEIFQQFLTYKLKPEHQLDSFKVVNQVYNFLYTWLALINRKKAIEVVQSEEHEEEELTLEDYIQSTGISQTLLSNLFLLIADKLDYLKYENDFPLSSEELLQEDFTLNVDEQHHLEQKLFQLSAKVLFYYSINFPLYLRTFMDKSKKYKTVCEKLLRNYISDAIFAKQVGMIEVREPQWKASNNLEIYVIKKNKEIYAEYQHDVIRIGLRLVMRPNYPLTPIHIEFGEGLKMEDGTKWALMLQSQLHNKNNSIINGIILWKENIDKKLSGIEQCAICYDIVDPKGHLPKKACKTCKKKFHSNCIMKWFSKSNKSECPLCKSQFL